MTNASDINDEGLLISLQLTCVSDGTMINEVKENLCLGRKMIGSAVEYDFNFFTFAGSSSPASHSLTSLIPQSMCLALKVTSSTVL